MISTTHQGQTLHRAPRNTLTTSYTVLFIDADTIIYQLHGINLAIINTCTATGTNLLISFSHEITRRKSHSILSGLPANTLMVAATFAAIADYNITVGDIVGSKMY